MIQVFMCLLVLGPSLYSIAEGCGRVPATPAPPTTPAPTEPTINGSLRAIECNSEEHNKTACLNGGTCFVLVIQGDRTATCHCLIEYKGRRCEEFNVELIIPSLDPNQVAKAGIAASIAVLVVIIIVLTAVAIVYFRRKRKQKAEQALRDEQAHKNLMNGLPENHAQQANPNMQRNGNHSNHLNCDNKKLLAEFHEYQVTSV